MTESRVVSPERRASRRFGGREMLRNGVLVLLVGAVTVPLACSGSSNDGGKGGAAGRSGGNADDGADGGNRGGSGGTTSPTGGAGSSNGGSAGSGGSGATTGGASGASGVAGSGESGGEGADGGGETGGAGGKAGDAGMNGSGGGGGMSGGRAGAGGSGGDCPTIPELFPASGSLGSLDGRLFEAPCGIDSSDDYQCILQGLRYAGGSLMPCNNQNATLTQDFVVGGTPGATYQTTLHFYGVVEPFVYGVDGVTRDAGNTDPENLDTGATPPPFAVGTPGMSHMLSDHNSYELHVLDANLQEVGVYFLNSATTDIHTTYVLNYERTIPVIGGGRVRAYYVDRNCRQTRNCGTEYVQSMCNTRARTVDISAANPQPGALSQPGLGLTANYAGQWLLIDVTGVRCP
jgi:hypothetical protein